MVRPTYTRKGDGRMTDEARHEDRNNQAAQHELMERANQEPGIAEALAAYQTFQPYLGQPTLTARPQVHFATGGNS